MQRQLRPTSSAALASCLIALGILAGDAAADDAGKPEAKPRRTLYLLTRQNSEKSARPTSLLARELYRQGLLIAARDGLGLQTRDESLREWRGAPPADATWDLAPSPARIEITAGAGPAIWHEEKPKNPEWPAQVFDHLADIESLSRGDFVKLLEANGFSGTGNVTKPGAAAPADAEARLGELEELSQFAILRKAHDLIRRDGESEPRLGALVRGYANLAQLTRFHWSVEPKVYAARSLLYAQRMVASDPKSAVALWHRAYAMALAGRQGQAMSDLDAAKKLGDEAKAPAWVPLLDPYCHYDLGKLTDLAAADATRAPLAMYLAFLTVEKSGCQAATLNTEKAALELSPHCLRLIDAMCDQTGPGLLNWLVDEGPRVFSATLGEELEKAPGLPQPVIQQIRALRRAEGNPAGREIICQSLVEQGTPENDAIEPSWAALGREIQETTFAQVRRKADLIALQWGVDASDYVAEVRPLVADHRFKGVIDVYGAIHEDSPAKAATAMRSVALGDLTLAELPLYRLGERDEVRDNGAGSKLLDRFFQDMDPNSFDKEAWLALYDGTLSGTFLDQVLRPLRAASPESPWIACSDIRNHWDAAKAPEWERSHGGYPSIELALGKKYAQLGRTEDAARCFKQYIKVSPDATGYQALANMYKAQRQDDLWLATLKDFLNKTQPIALEHAQVQTEIAGYYMSRNQYKEALPFADAAARTGAAWGLSCAAKAHAGAGDFDGAEKLIVEEFEHYSSSPFGWVSWCLETGHGHRDAAMKAFQDYRDSRGANASAEDLYQMALVDLIDGKKDEAIAGLQKRLIQKPGPLSLVHLIVIADEAGDAASRDAAVKRAAALRDPSPVASFAKVLATAYRDGAPLDLKSVDAIAQGADETDRITVRVLTARHLMKRGEKEAAKRYVEQCYFGFEDYCADNLLVYQASRDLGIDPLTAGKPATRPSN